MKTIKDIHVEDVQDLFDSIIFLRGEEYFEEGSVISLEPLDSSAISGTVRGNQDYSVTVSIDTEGDLSCDCSCPCDFNCKHAAALLLKWLSVKDRCTEDLKKGKKQSKESMRQMLARKSKDELIELTETFLKKNPELKTFVCIEKKEIVSKIKTLFSKFWEWNEVSDLISKLETILEGIRRNKSKWDKSFLNDLEIGSEIMIKNTENVHDEGDLGLFLEDWFLTYGEIFRHTKPSLDEKKQFIQKITGWVDEDDYGLDSSYEKALIGMCATPEDIQLIEEYCKQPDLEDYKEDYYKEFLLELYDRVGLHEKYLKTAKQEGFSEALIDKLIFLNRLQEALEACEKNNKKEFSETIENKRIVIFKKLGKCEEAKKALLQLTRRTGGFSYAIKLKHESSPKE